MARELNGSLAERRELMREILEGPIRYTADGESYAFEGDLRMMLLAGVIGLPPKLARPRGSEIS